MLLFMIPADSKDIAEEYEILLNELKQYNPNYWIKNGFWLSPSPICSMRNSKGD